jgi:hypothetical protein
MAMRLSVRHHRKGARGGTIKATAQPVEQSAVRFAPDVRTAGELAAERDSQTHRASA